MDDDLKARVDRLEAKVAALEQENYRQAERIALLEKDNKAVWKRIDEQTKLINEVHELATTLKIVIERQGVMMETIKTMQDAMEAIKAKPGTQWERVISTIITAGVGGIIAYILLQLGLK